ncbi:MULTISPECIES: hypothetical protein [unclassified Sphingobacterium]|uniref:hypothetical protein n=1 Tax=unclassified Sphingobacterium TaxID=2609468 RepID=UPI0010481693|nr:MULTISPECIES: hypothetical protein [unclassified Sphingobacterium]MCS3557404.1 hypothetical protein [Sphingobacterium sp. JUb21]TCQ96701.1 hypothetical protein EDF66_12143 [Sphingobacterium sp. JUb20]
MEHLTPIITAALPIFIYWANSFIKSKNISNQIDRLKSEIEFNKGFNDELCSTLSHIYCAKIFQQQFGFEVVPSRVNAYLQCFNTCDVSTKTFKYLYKKLYLKFDKASQKVNIIVTKTDKYVVTLISFAIIYILVFSIIILYFFLDTNNILASADEVLTIRIVLIIAYIISSYFAIKLFVNDIIPYFQARSIIKNLAQNKGLS